MKPAIRAAEEFSSSEKSSSGAPDAQPDRKVLTRRAYDLGKRIKTAGDLSLDSSGKLDNYINRKFEIMGGIKSLPLDKFSDLFDDLEEKLTKAEELKDDLNEPSDIRDDDKPPF